MNWTIQDIMRFTPTSNTCTSLLTPLTHFLSVHFFLQTCQTNFETKNRPCVGWLKSILIIKLEWSSASHEHMFYTHTLVLLFNAIKMSNIQITFHSMKYIYILQRSLNQNIVSMEDLFFYHVCNYISQS